MYTMKQLTVLAVLSLCCTSLTSGTGDCHPEGPEDCNIVPEEYSQRYRTVCSWSLGHDLEFVYDQDERFKWFVRLINGSEEGNLTSRTACSTGGETHCLQFWYKFQQNNTIDLSVSIQYEGTDEAESPLWIMSSSVGWDSGRVPISTVQNFTVVFKTKRRPAYISSLASVFLDTFSYSTSPCPSGMDPANAQPTTTTTSTTTNIFSTTTAPSTKLTRKDIASETTKPNHSEEEVTTEGTISNTSSPPQTDSEMPLGNVGVIVGAVMAVVVLFGIISVLVFVLRRKQRKCKPPCPREQPEPDNDDYEIPDTPRTDNTNNREIATGTDQEDIAAHQAAPPDGQREVSDVASPEPAAANYDRLDFSDAQNDTRVYADLHVNTRQATPGRELYETLTEQRDNHVYSEALRRI